MRLEADVTTTANEVSILFIRWIWGLMSFDRINRITRTFYKALDATEIPLVFSHMALQFNSIHFVHSV